MTLDELEKWLVLMFAQYHRDVHTGIGTTPMAKWREGIVGTKAQRGRGLPVLRLDAEKLRIDFMPFEERGVYDYGVVIDEVHYFHDVLRPWMNNGIQTTLGMAASSASGAILATSVNISSILI